MKASMSARSVAARATAILAALYGAAYSAQALALEWNLRPAGSKLADDIHGLHEIAWRDTAFPEIDYRVYGG